MKTVWLVEHVDWEYDEYTDGVWSVHETESGARAEAERLGRLHHNDTFTVNSYEVKP